MNKTVLILILACIYSFSAEIDSRLESFFKNNPNKSAVVWIFFKDKGQNEKQIFLKENTQISERALNRRSKISSQQLYDIHDVPVFKEYIQSIQDLSIPIRHSSRWLNAVSASIKKQDIQHLDEISFIKKIKIILKSNANRQFKSHGFEDKSIEDLDYGNSDIQMIQIGADRLHEYGLTGKNVVIALLDEGFYKYKTHSVFDSLQVIGTWDFVNDDEDVDDNQNYPGEGNHGSQVLSVLAGYSPGNLIGPAYNAKFLLAKTENDAIEEPVEEDNWVAGLEWAEAQGADIVNSSLNYIDWYNSEDLDGQTAVTTIATNIAEQKGMIVVNSVGNDGNKASSGTLNPPADGLYVIAVGAVSGFGNKMSWSSTGPTFDGRIKPDVMARGGSVTTASLISDNSFSTGSGTSLAAPLVTGAIAQLLEAFPELTPAQVRNTIKLTASQSNTPDNSMGYGILNIYAAYNYFLNDSLPVPSDFSLSQNIPNPFNATTRIEFEVRSHSKVKITIFDVAGRQVLLFPVQVVQDKGFVEIDGSQLGASGIYFYRIDARETLAGRHFSETKKMVFVK